MPQSATFIIADDHAIYRDGLSMLLSRQPGFTVLAEAGSGRELVEVVQALRPDIVITDIDMPEMDGIEATRLLMQQMPALKVIALSMHNSDGMVVDMLEAGARGYLVKNFANEEILEAIEAVMEGSCWFCHQSSGQLARLIASSRFELAAQQQSVHFTEREKQVIRMVCQQHSSKEMAEALHLSYRTVEGLRAGVLQKMGVRNTVGIAVFALRYGLISSNELMK